MSTDGAVPERWRDNYVAIVVGAALDNSDTPFVVKVISELGTAESLVRELAQALQDTRRFVVYPAQLEIIDMALSRIPSHLRAPETTDKEPE